jgi:hypothetical protein
VQGAGGGGPGDSRREGGREGGQVGAGRSHLAWSGRPGLPSFLGPQVWGLREEVREEGYCYLPQMHVLQKGRRVRTSDYLLNPLECLFVSLFFGALVFNGLLYGHMCGN